MEPGPPEQWYALAKKLGAALAGQLSLEDPDPRVEEIVAKARRRGKEARRQAATEQGEVVEVRMMKYWLLLLAAILLEVCGTTSMKLSEGYTKLLPSVLVWVFYTASFICGAFALKGIPLSVAYAIWSALGIALVTTVGIFYFREPVTILRIIAFGVIMAGVIMLRLS